MPHRARDTHAAGSIGRSPSHDERHWRHVDPLLGAELASEAVGFLDTLGVDPALWGQFDSRGIHTRRLAAQLRRSGAVLRHHRAGSRRERESRQSPGPHRSCRQRLRRSPAARVSHASAARRGIYRSHAGHCPAAWMETLPPARGHQFATLSRPRRVRVSRLLQCRRMSRGREELDRDLHHSRRGADQKPDHLRQSPGHAHRD